MTRKKIDLQLTGIVRRATSTYKDNQRIVLRVNDAKVNDPFSIESHCRHERLAPKLHLKRKAAPEGAALFTTGLELQPCRELNQTRVVGICR